MGASRQVCTIQRTALSRQAAGGFYPPLQMAFTIQRTAQFCGFRADSIRPYSGVYKTAALQSAHSPEPIIFLSIRGNAEHIRRTQLRNSAADGLVNLNQLL